MRSCVQGNIVLMQNRLDNVGLRHVNSKHCVQSEVFDTKGHTATLYASLYCETSVLHILN